MSESERKEYLAKQAVARKEKMRQQMKERLKRQRKVRQSFAVNYFSDFSTKQHVVGTQKNLFFEPQKHMCRVMS